MVRRSWGEDFIEREEAQLRRTMALAAEDIDAQEAMAEDLLEEGGTLALFELGANQASEDLFEDDDEETVQAPMRDAA